jgi:hypothetical protein
MALNGNPATCAQLAPHCEEHSMVRACHVKKRHAHLAYRARHSLAHSQLTRGAVRFLRSYMLATRVRAVAKRSYGWIRLWRGRTWLPSVLACLANACMARNHPQCHLMAANTPCAALACVVCVCVCSRVLMFHLHVYNMPHRLFVCCSCIIQCPANHTMPSAKPHSSPFLHVTTKCHHQQTMPSP